MSREKPDVVVASLVKHLRIPPGCCARCLSLFRQCVGRSALRARRSRCRRFLDFLPKEQVKDITPEKYIDNSLIKELETSGFIKNLYRK